MSTVVMSAVWPLQGMTPAQKAVLVSLADNANDEGVCWPAVATIAMRTCLSERAVQAAIKWLVQAQALSVRQRDGRSTVYQVTPAAYAPPQEMHPRKSRTPAGNAPTPADAAPPPPQMPHPTPADAAPRTVKEPSVEPSGNRKGAAPRPAAGAASDLPAGKSVEELNKDELWAAGKSLLLQSGMPKAQCGSFVGKLVKDYGADLVMGAVRAAVVERPADSVAYLKATCQRLRGERKDAKATVFEQGMANAEAAKRMIFGDAHAAQ
ncbi:helix-turn-helix domain-containing protein [Pigmentiphaga sp. YJ18]|uniref:helix-turn-helix domain-containing protein n=1 Tax=Pigmentiphaga sp. YJ18 TaxID=3134907 RepID=UPI003112EA71